MAADDEIKVSLTADYSDLEDGMEAATESVTAGAQTMQAAIEESAAATTAATQEMVQQQAQAYLTLDQILQGNITTISGMVEAEAALDLLQKDGLVSAKQLTKAFAELGGAEADIQRSAIMAAAGITEEVAASEAATAATDENTAAMVINGGVARELGVLMGELARGNYTRLEGSSITLANRTGLLSQVFSPLGLMIGATGVAAAGLTYELLKGEEQSNAYEKALINTGGVLGVTEGQFNSMADAIHGGETTIGTAREAMMDFAQTGRVGGDVLETAGKAAVDFAALTGESMEKAVAAIVKIEEDPVKALQQLNNQYHFLTLAQLEHIQQLENEGQKTEAAAEAIKLFQGVSTERLAIADTDVGTLVQWWRNLKQAVSDAGDEVQAFGRKQTLEEQITQLKQQITDTKAGYSTLVEAFGRKVEVYNPFHPMVADTSLLEEQLAKLEAQAGDNRLATSQKAAAQATQDAAIAAKGQNDEILKGMKGTSEYTAALDKELAALRQIHEANADDASLKGINFDSGGNATGGEGLAKIETYLHKKYDLKATAHQKEHTLDLQELQQEEADEGVSYDKRLQFELNFWQGKMAAAKTGSKEYAQAYREVETLQKQLDEESARSADKAAKAELKSKLEALDQAKAAYDSDTETQKQQYQLQFDQGQITASKLAELERDLVNKKLLADIAYLTAKENLDRAAGQSGIDQANKEEAAIVAVKQKASQDLLKIDQQQIKDSEKNWSAYGNQIAGSFKTALNGMLFQGETWKQGMASIAESMAENFISAAIEKPLGKWIAAEASKLSATVASLTGQATATNTQRAADATADAISSVASVTRASGVAGAMGTASFAGAPWPIDLGAPAFGAAMAMSAMGYASVASASGGWGDVPADQLAMIHKNEMVLPANIADHVRNSAAGSTSPSGGGNTGDQHIHFNISAMDAKSFRTALGSGLGTQLAQYVKQKTQNSPQARR